MPHDTISIETAYLEIWKECFVHSKTNPTDIYPPPLNVVTSKKETAKILGFNSYKELVESGQLVGGEILTKTKYSGRDYLVIPTSYHMHIFKPNLDRFVEKEFNNELPYPAAAVFIDHLIIHEFCHYIYNNKRFRELIKLHQTDDLVSYRQMSDAFNDIYVEHHQLSGKFEDEKRTERMALKILRELYDIDARDHDDDGFMIMLPKHDSEYLKMLGVKNGLTRGINRDEYNIVFAMLRYLEIAYLYSFEYASCIGSVEYECTCAEINTIIKYIRQYSLENDDTVEFIP